MSRSRAAIPYEILHGIYPSHNASTMFAYLSYFPPPPPVIPGPPPRRSWTCSADSFSSCFISDDLNPSSLRQYIPNTKGNQSFLSSNTSHLSTSTEQSFKPFSLSDFFQNQLTLILLLIIFLSIFIFVILLLLLFHYIQRLRRRQSTPHSHVQTNVNSNNNSLESNNPKTQKFYSRLIPYRQKHRKRSRTLRTPLDGNNLLRLTNHESPVLEVKRLSKAAALRTAPNDEQEAAL